MSELPPKRDICCTIDLVPGQIMLVSKDPYRMKTLELVKLKMKLQDLMDKKYIRRSVSHWAAPVFKINN